MQTDAFAITVRKRPFIKNNEQALWQTALSWNCRQIKKSNSTDIIVGFPGETEEDFNETLDVVKKVQYDSAFTFIYSKRSGTPAAEMENQVPQDVVKDRFDRLLKVVNEISSKKTAKYEGTTQLVMAEEVNSHDPELITGRLSNNTVVHFKGTKDLIGQELKVKLLKAKGFYYFGEIEA